MAHPHPSVEFWDRLTRSTAAFEIAIDDVIVFRDPLFAVLEFCIEIDGWIRQPYGTDLAFSPIDGPDNLFWFKYASNGEYLFLLDGDPAARVRERELASATADLLRRAPDLASEAGLIWHQLRSEALERGVAGDRHTE